MKKWMALLTASLLVMTMVGGAMAAPITTLGEQSPETISTTSEVADTISIEITWDDLAKVKYTWNSDTKAWGATLDTTSNDEIMTFDFTNNSAFDKIVEGAWSGAAGLADYGLTVTPNASAFFTAGTGLTLAGQTSTPATPAITELTLAVSGAVTPSKITTTTSNITLGTLTVTVR